MTKEKVKAVISTALRTRYLLGNGSTINLRLVCTLRLKTLTSLPKSCISIPHIYKPLSFKRVADFTDEYELPPIPEIKLDNPTDVLDVAMEKSRD